MIALLRIIALRRAFCMHRSRKILLIAAGIIECLALCTLLYFAFVSPPGENRLAGARFILNNVCFG